MCTGIHTSIAFIPTYLLAYGHILMEALYQHLLQQVRGIIARVPNKIQMYLYVCLCVRLHMPYMLAEIIIII